MSVQFFCIGAQKAGTGWLYDQFRSHPEVWKPPFKELRFFLNRSYHLANIEASKRLSNRISALIESPDDKIEREGLDFLRRFVLDSRDRISDPVESYLRLFTMVKDRYVADISPQYAMLSAGMVQTLAQKLPELRSSMIVREPVSRFWSYYCMQTRRGQFKEQMAGKPEHIRRVLSIPTTHATDGQSFALLRWKEAFGSRFRAYVMDDLIREPDAFRKEIMAYAGLNADDCALPADHNAKSNRYKVDMSDEIAALLEAHFAPERQRLQNMLGGSTSQWKPR